MESTSYKNMVQREDNAAKNMIESIMTLGHITNQQAVAVFNLYLQEKLIVTKHAHHGGGYQVKHGSFLDSAVIKRAVKMARESKI